VLSHVFGGLCSTVVWLDAFFYGLRMPDEEREDEEEYGYDVTIEGNEDGLRE
jgi:hypothetical protein